MVAACDEMLVTFHAWLGMLGWAFEMCWPLSATVFRKLYRGIDEL